MIKRLKRGAGRLLLPVLALLSLQCAAPVETEVRPAALRDEALQYLWQKQGADGGWHSETHAIMKSGQVLTPFILFTLLQADSSARVEKKEQVELALNFIRTHMDTSGVLGLSDPVLVEYPNYATSYALRVLLDAGDASDEGLIYRMAGYLIDQQFDESRSIEASHAAYGGWGFGETTLARGQVGYVDLSHTRRILQALRLYSDGPFQAGPRVEASSYKKALVFLARAQKREHPSYDGGFFYSPVVFAANKGRLTFDESDNPVHGSYATATCDGLLALLTADLPSTSQSAADAHTWLKERLNLEYPAGIPRDQPGQWHHVMQFYNLSVHAEVFDLLGWPETSRTQMATLFADRVQADGSFSNPYGSPNKEDDPLLATALAISALHKLTKNKH